MSVFHVHLNGKKVATAGINDLGALSAVLTLSRREMPPTKSQEASCIEEDYRLYLGGFLKPEQEHLRWLTRDLKVGDEVRITIAEKGRVSRPESREKRDSAKELRAQKRYLRDMAKRFGWKIQTKKQAT